VAGVPAKVVRQATEDDLTHIRLNAQSYTERLPGARKVRPVVRRPLPPAGYTPGDAAD
jgi:carbonic anhydrase/acetyltransferase-like protein (isoleucine patch superfamily)